MTSKLRPQTAKPKTRAGSLTRELATMLRRECDKLKGEQWPSDVYQRDPVAFVREQLHEEPLPHQIQILESARDNFKVAVRSGQKTGKTKLVIWLALWFYCSFPKARVFMIAAVAAQVKRVLWTELKNTLRHAKKQGFEMPELPAENPETGLLSDDGREIRGFTVRDIEAMAGLSGNILFIVDEASALLGPIAEAIEGNLAGDGRMIWISNPTRTEGPFFEAFNSPEKSTYWKLFHLSSEKVAQYCDRHGLAIPGVATLRRIAGWEAEYKRDSPFFTVRILGEFLKNETGRCISLQDISDAQQRWANAEDDEGRLSIGIDPAGPGDEGDEFAFAIVRGAKLLALFTFHGLTEEAAWAHLKSFLATYRRKDEIPQVIIDSEGAIGSSIYYKFKGISETLRRSRPADGFECYGVKSSHNARREPLVYERIREELWANCAEWLKTGAIVSDHKLEVELHAPMWIGTLKAKLKATPKNELREKLGRSPDRADALCLAVWTPGGLYEGKRQPGVEEDDNAGIAADDGPAAGGIDPYGYGL
jgi:phage terminase large subunit